MQDFKLKQTNKSTKQKNSNNKKKANQPMNQQNPIKTRYQDLSGAEITYGEKLV